VESSSSFSEQVITGENFMSEPGSGFEQFLEFLSNTKMLTSLGIGKLFRAVRLSLARYIHTLREDQRQAVGKVSSERARLETQLTGVRNRMDAAYVDKLDGKIPQDFWERKMSEWRMEELQVKMAIQGLSNAETGDRALDAQRIFELANKVYSLYVSQNLVEKAKLLKTLFSNCSVDAVSVTPTYRKPFDLIFKRAHLEEWSGRLDSN